MILDTNGLSALADGEPTLEPVLRTAAQVAIPVIRSRRIPIWDFTVS